MGSFGPNFGNNFAAISTSALVIFIPTKRITADLCVNTNVKENLCVTNGVKEDLCN